MGDSCQETLLEPRCASGGSRRRDSDFCARPGRLRATRRAEPLCDRREPHRRR